MLPMLRNIVYHGTNLKPLHYSLCNMCVLLLTESSCLPEIQSVPSETPVNVGVEFWDLVGYTECVHSHLRKFVFQAARGKDSELAFVKFVMGRAQMLEQMLIFVDDGSSRDVVMSHLSSEGCVSADATVVVESHDKSYPWNFHIASNMLQSDPFACST